MKALKKILIIDSNESERSKLKHFLEKEGFEVEGAVDGETGIQLLIEGDYDLNIVELELPGINGADVCNIVRKIKETPIIVLISNGEEKNMLSSLRAGMDDYILKPYIKAEMLHRVKATFRRATTNDFTVIEQDKNQIRLPNAVIEWEAHRITGGGKEIYLTPKEYELLQYLTSWPNKILSRDELLQAVWNDEQSLDTRTVDTAIKRLRDKFSKISPETASTIKTVWRVGYIFEI